MVNQFLNIRPSISGYTIDLENTSIDLSYTFGDEYTLTLGSSAVSSGKLTIISSDSDIYNSSNVEGYGYFGILGIEYGIFEILLGYQNIRYTFIELESESTSTNLEEIQGFKKSICDRNWSCFLNSVGI